MVEGSISRFPFPFFFLGGGESEISTYLIHAGAGTMAAGK